MGLCDFFPANPLLSCDVGPEGILGSLKHFLLYLLKSAFMLCYGTVLCGEST